MIYQLSAIIATEFLELAKCADYFANCPNFVKHLMAGKRKRAEDKEAQYTELLELLEGSDSSYKSVLINGVNYSLGNAVLTKADDSALANLRLISSIEDIDDKCCIFGYWLRPAYGKLFEAIIP